MASHFFSHKLANYCSSFTAKEWVDIKSLIGKLGNNDCQGPPLRPALRKAVADLLGYRTKLGLEVESPKVISCCLDNSELLFSTTLPGLP
jgi:hypothetical protein